MTFRKAATVLTMLAILLLGHGNDGNATNAVFEQGKGYQKGAYDLSAEQPTSSNWSGQSRFLGLEKQVQKWMFSEGAGEQQNLFYTSPVVGADGTVYAGADGGHLYAIKPDGTKKWAFKINGDFSEAPVIGKGGVVYFRTTENKLYAVNPNGTKKWVVGVGKDKLSSGISIGVDGTLYLCVSEVPNSLLIEKSYLYAINPNGTIKWKIANLRFFHAPVIGVDGTIYVVSGGKLIALLPNGRKKWECVVTSKEYPFDAFLVENEEPKIGSDGTIYLGSQNSPEIFAILPSGKVKWKVSLKEHSWGRYVIFNAAIAADTLYVASYDKLYAIDLKGKLKWVNPIVEGKKANITGESLVISADGLIYWTGIYALTYESGYMAVIAFSADGKQKKLFQTTVGILSGQPALGKNRTMYFPSYKKGIIAFGK
ncbi:PQQ-binding-like beta-propeller repeat protein [Brevibacillus sp. SYSU BS000544]|uniref:outer membrane protein assembly factor BamB family protein n=1 Tax=Brevibacillus sp. SYSU BS000544 TaxID=3416443 RepID=UPI003CE56084